MANWRLTITVNYVDDEKEHTFDYDTIADAGVDIVRTIEREVDATSFVFTVARKPS